MEPPDQFRHKAWWINTTWETEKGGFFVGFRPVAGMCPATLEMLSFFWRAVDLEVDLMSLNGRHGMGEMGCVACGCVGVTLIDEHPLHKLVDGQEAESMKLVSHIHQRRARDEK